MPDIFYMIFALCSLQLNEDSLDLKFQSSLRTLGHQKYTYKSELYVLFSSAPAQANLSLFLNQK
jgi:hypothetical protein